MEHEARQREAVTGLSRKSPRGIADASDLRDTLDRALHTGSRIIENRMRLMALDARDEARALGRGAVILTAAGVSAAFAWISLVAALAALLWPRLPAETVLATIASFHALAAVALLLAGRNRIEAARRETRAARDREESADGP